MELICDEISTQIIESAKRIAKEKQTGKITVRDILKDLNITNRVFYNRFHKIDDVLEIIYNETISRVRESLNITWDENSDYIEHVIEVASRTLLLSYESRQDISQYVFETDSASNLNFVWWSQEIRKLIQIGKTQGYFRSDLDEEIIGYSIWCFIRGFNADAIGRNLPKGKALKQFQYSFMCFLNGMK